MSLCIGGARHPKRCTKCRARKPLTEFHRQAASKDGHTARCKKCLNAAQRVRNQTPAAKEYYRTYKQTPEYKAQLQTPEYKEFKHASTLRCIARNPENYTPEARRARNLRSIARNPETCSAAARYARNPDAYKSATHRRKMCKRKARPPWCTGKLEVAITVIYRQRDDLTASTSVQHCVDHFFGLKPRKTFIEGFGTVQPYSGLDVPWNLMVITAELNGSSGKHDKDPRVFYSKREFALIIRQLNKQTR